MTSLISFLIVISICVISHEGGHYLAARWRGVLVHEFSFGMGPVLWSRKRGETLWSVRAFPIGGFVRLEGEDGDGEAENGADLDHGIRSRSLFYKKPWERMVILSAGATVNLLLAWLLTAALLVGSGVLDLSRPAIGTIMEGTPAQEAGLISGDLILSINGVGLKEWGDIRKALHSDSVTGDEFTVVIEREGRTIEKKILIAEVQGGRMLGIQPPRVLYPVHEALARGLGYSWNMGTEIIRGLLLTITGRIKTDVVGPVGIAIMAGDAIKMGWWSFIAFLGVINLHLGLLNLFPFPALDGGRIIFVLFEMLTRRKIPEKWEAYVHLGGFVVLITLIVLITGKDILRLLG